MTHLGPETVVSFVGAEHLESALFSGSYGVLKGRVSMVIAAIMFALVFLAVPTLVIAPAASQLTHQLQRVTTEPDCAGV